MYDYARFAEFIDIALRRTEEQEAKLRILAFAAQTLSTHSWDSIRDGALALRYSALTCQQVGWHSLTCMELYAASLAELRNFSEATRLQQDLLSAKAQSGTSEGSGNDAAERLKAYTQGRPWRRPLTAREAKLLDNEKRGVIESLSGNPEELL